MRIMGVLGFLVLALFQVKASASVQAIIKNFDNRFYRPNTFGLRDLSFDVRIKGLEKELEKLTGVGKRGDVYFKVYWIQNGKFNIIVEGLPPGLYELRNRLKSIIVPRLDFVVPRSLAPQLAGYTLSEKKVKKSKSKIILGVDKTGKKDVNQMELRFGPRGKLTTFIMYSSNDQKVATLNMRPRAWSRNRWVLHTYEVLIDQGTLRTTIKSAVDYLKQDGFGLPKSISIATSQILGGVSGNNKKESTIELSFSNYQVNKGKALQFLKARKAPKKKK